MAAASFFASSLIQGLIILCNPSYVAQGWHGTFLYWAVIFLALSVNTIFSKLLPAFEVTFLILHCLGVFAVLIPLVRLAPHTESNQIWWVFSEFFFPLLGCFIRCFSRFGNTDFEIFRRGTFMNSGWSSMSLAFFVGLEGVVAPFVGTDGAIHVSLHFHPSATRIILNKNKMSEEIKGAAKTVPRAMIYSIMINGFLGGGILLATLYCAGDLQAAADSPTGYPFIAIFASGVKSTAGATVMVCYFPLGSPPRTPILRSGAGFILTHCSRLPSEQEKRMLICCRFLSP